MKNKTKFQILLSIMVIIVLVYSWDMNGIIRDINYNNKQIETQNYKLSQGNLIRGEIENFQHLFMKKKKKIVSHGITGSELADEVKFLKNQANLSGVIINNIDVHSLDTFPFYNDSATISIIPLQRHIISVEAKGDFLKIGALLEEIHKNSENLEIGECLFSLDDDDPKGIIASLKYYTYSENHQ
ncbi:MAG: hypothetical protein CMG62_11195 [Candidatus Marinimicrobia bacterium]|nr:hypothetical protein [Candidatus Neomarinimicrobiota bacterium]|tara:strand:- start:263 stop:817 length:555 start_codon:yes stop_codon:yes gene_type:complete